MFFIYVCFGGYYEVVVLFLQYGVFINVFNNKGNMVLYEVVIEKYVFVVELFLFYGVLVQVLNKWQCMVVDCVEQNLKIMELFQVVLSCVVLLDDVVEIDCREYVIVKIRKKWNLKLYDLLDEFFIRQFYFVYLVGQFKGKILREIMVRDRSVFNLIEGFLYQLGR